VADGGICGVVTSCGSGLSLHLLVLTVSGSKMRFELHPSFFDGMFFVPPSTCTHEVTCCEYLGVSNVDLLGVPNEEAACLRMVGNILNLLEQGLNWLLWIPSPTHVFEIDLQVNRSDVALSLEEVIQHVS
jgi:hypothetical protein